MLKGILITIAIIVAVIVVFAHFLFFTLQNDANASMDWGPYGRFLLKITGNTPPEPFADYFPKDEDK